LSSEKKDFKLFRFEYLSMGDRVVDWVWLTGDEEAKEYLTAESHISGVVYREATGDEHELYDEAFNDGLGLGQAEARMESYNGLSYRLNSMNLNSENEKLGIDTTKVFTCGECGESSLEFEIKAVTTGEYYVAKEKEGVLWYVCFDCAYNCRHDWTHFSRSFCACGSMHYYCDTCGEALDCELDDPYAETPYKKNKKKRDE
jgi:hypothetical protein